MPDPIDTQDQQTDQPTGLPGFFSGQTLPAQGGAGSAEQLKAMFGETGDQVPLAHNDSATDIGSGVKAGMDPHPIDPQSKQLFDFMYSHKFKPVIINGKPAYDNMNQPIFEHKKDDTGQDIIDPKTGKPVLEKSDYYVSPARKILQGILSNALALGAPAVTGHPDILREQKKEQWNTEQQVALQAAYKNAATNVQYARIQATNARQQNALEFKRDHDTMTNQQFQQKYQMSKQRYDLSVKAESDAEDARTKRLNGQKLDREETLLTHAYGPAAAQAQAEWLRDNPSMTQEDAAQAPWVKGRAKDLYDLSKPHEAANMALEKMIGAGELTGEMLQNPAALVDAAQKSKTLTDQEKKDVLLDQLPGQQKFGQQQENIKLQNAGRLAAANVTANKPPKSLVLEWDDATNQYIPKTAVQGGPPVSAGAITPAALNPTTTTKGAAEQGSIIKDYSAPHLQGVIDQLNAKGKIGNFSAFYKTLISNTPAADPEIAYLQTALKSFADLNPKLHGFRGQQIGQEFERVIGGPVKNAEALKAAIQAIADQAGIIENAVPSVARRVGAQGGGGKVEVRWGRDPVTHQLVQIPVKK